MEISLNLLKLCEFLEEKKAEDIVVVDARHMSNIADFYIIATSTSSVHTKGIADFLETEALKLNGFDYVSREGFNLSDWVVLDLNNVFVHILTKQKRDYYSLEKLLNEGNNIKTYDKFKKEFEKSEKELKNNKEKGNKVKGNKQKENKEKGKKEKIKKSKK